MAEDPASRIAHWQQHAGRHGLPWQGTRDPYRIWLSEIMLQQTQAATVIAYYQRFLTLFPDVQALADAPLDAVLQAWAGLGYYARARNLHRCAQTIRDTHQGQFPRTATALAQLPGVGASTAAAIAAFAYGTRAAILDGNVRRVLIRFHAIEDDPHSTATTRRLWQLADAWLQQAPATLDMRAYTQGQMDLGALVCTRRNPDCARCPLAPDCAARQQGRQDSLPLARKRKPLPQREASILVLHCESAILLQRRPEHGIWGGLWSLPQFEGDQALKAACRPLAGIGALHPLPMIPHTFTHFRLHLHPWCLSLAAPVALPLATDAQVKEELAGTWVPWSALPRHGLPAPITRLLRQIQDAPATPPAPPSPPRTKSPDMRADQ